MKRDPPRRRKSNPPELAFASATPPDSFAHTMTRHASVL